MKTNCKLLNSRDLKKIRKILATEKVVRVYRRALALMFVHLGYKQDDIEKSALMKQRTIRNLITKYERGGLDCALYDGKRQGKPPKFKSGQVERITAMACTAPPEGQARWTLDLLKEISEKTGIVPDISRETLRVALALRHIKPWRHKMWCIPKVDEEFAQRMEGVLEIYEREYNPKEPVVCIDEKPIQLLKSYRPDIRGKIVKFDYEYMRNGVVNAFCGIESKAGRHFILIRERKAMKDFAIFVRKIIKSYPNAKTIHLVMDNLSTHKEKSLIETFGKRLGKKLWKKITPHYTPKHASWLNQAEIEISMFSRGCLGKNRVANVSDLRQRAAKWKNRMNRKKVKIDWKFSRRNARKKFKYKPAKINLPRH